MTAGTLLTGAPTHNQTVDWTSLNWRKLEKNVRRLQARIVQAITTASCLTQRGV
jgi:hypothetical protein